MTKGSFDHPYPTTNIQWAPKSLAARRDMLATTGDFLRLWEVKDSGQVDFVSLLNPNKNSEYCAPLTSFDWNLTDENMVGTSSIDTTCTIWDINVEKVRTQLIAHDKEVYDIAFATGKHIFGTVGSDGSLRLFDLRSLEHSTIMYESPDATPLLRLRWNLMDPNYIACVTMDSSTVIVLDIRMPATAAATLRTHTAAANCLAWAPHSSCHLCSGADDNQALIWDLASLPKSVEGEPRAPAAGRRLSHARRRHPRPTALRPRLVCLALPSAIQRPAATAAAAAVVTAAAAATHAAPPHARSRPPQTLSSPTAPSVRSTTSSGRAPTLTGSQWRSTTSCRCCGCRPAPTPTDGPADRARLAAPAPGTAAQPRLAGQRSNAGLRRRGSWRNQRSLPVPRQPGPAWPGPRAERLCGRAGRACAAFRWAA